MLGLVPMMLSAASDVNPDATGRPSPIVVRVYQLRADAAFAAADFFALFDEEQQTLEDVVEPFLLKIGFIVRTPQGRKTTPEGATHAGFPNAGASVQTDQGMLL